METKEKYNVTEIIWPARTFVGKRVTLPFDKLKAFFSESYRLIFDYIHSNHIEQNEPPCAIYYRIDEKMKEADLAAAVPVKGWLTESQEFENILLPESRVLTTTYYGPYDKMKPAYLTMEQYLREHGLKRDLIIEEYFSDPAIEDDPDRWKTKIHFIVKPLKPKT